MSDFVPSLTSVFPWLTRVDPEAEISSYGPSASLVLVVFEC